VTANGERYNEEAFTCASMKYKFGTWLKVTNIENLKFVLVRVTDRGGFKKYGRIIDLSKGAFSKIANLKQGIITVKIGGCKMRYLGFVKPSQCVDFISWMSWDCHDNGFYDFHRIFGFEFQTKRKQYYW
jgi:rare lipoprotein A